VTVEGTAGVTVDGCGGDEVGSHRHQSARDAG